MSSPSPNDPPRRAERRRASSRAVRFAEVVGVDFSGAAQAGRATWLARLVPATRAERRAGAPPLRLASLDRLGALAGTTAREAALAHLVARVRASGRAGAPALWAFDFPFGLPLEVLPADATWRAPHRLVREWAHDGYGMGVECVRRAVAAGHAMHVRRLTDAVARAPFDPYHYRIIWQTFHGLRDVVMPLLGDAHTAVLPFQHRRLTAGARRALVETCPGSTLRRWGLPFQRYKRPEGGPLGRERAAVRREVVAGLRERVAMDAVQVRRLARDSGGDALDAVVAGAGAWEAAAGADHAALARHPRYGREGHLYF